MWRHGFDWNCDVIIDVYNIFGVSIIDEISFSIRLLFCHFLNDLTLHAINGIGSGFSCIVPIRCPDNVPALVYGSYRASDQRFRNLNLLSFSNPQHVIPNYKWESTSETHINFIDRGRYLLSRVIMPNAKVTFSHFFMNGPDSRNHSLLIKTRVVRKCLNAHLPGLANALLVTCN